MYFQLKIRVAFEVQTFNMICVDGFYIFFLGETLVQQGIKLKSLNSFT